LTYDPKKSELTISGGRLKQEIRKSITRGIYFPLCFMYPIIGQEITLQWSSWPPRTDGFVSHRYIYDIVYKNLSIFK